MDDLIKIALAGTNRVPFDASRDERGAVRLTALARSSGDASTTDAAATLLLACGAEAVYRSAGYRPRTDVPALPPAPEDRPVASASVADAALAWFSPKELAAELERANLLVPNELLPEVLAVEDPEQRAVLLPSIGARGRWLAALDASTAWAAGSFESRDLASLRKAFDEGTIDERVAAFVACRAVDAAEGLRWLIEAFKTEKAENRQRLLLALAPQASLADEDFLEVALRDRSKLVSVAAADILREVPGSKLLARQLARAEDSLVGARDATGKLRLQTKLPAEIPADWQRDFGSPLVLPEKSPKWAAIVSVLGTVPPSHWESRFDATPQELIEAAVRDHFGDAVALAWGTPQALGRLPEASRRRWWNALFAYASELEGLGEKRAFRDSATLVRLAETLDTSTFDAWLGISESLPERSIRFWIASTQRRMPLLREPAIVSKVVAAVRRTLASAAGDASMQWAGLLDTLVHLVTYEDMPAALEPWTLPESDDWHARHVVQRVEAFLDSLRRRRRLIEAIRAEASLSSS